MKMWKKGDRVRLEGNNYSNSPSNPLFDVTKIKGSIKEVRKTGTQNIVVNWDNGHYNYYYPDDLTDDEEKIIDVDELFDGIDL